MKRLFKYVVAERIDVLANGTLRFTQPHLFNDPFELQTVTEGLIDDQDAATLDDDTLDFLAGKIPQLRPELAKKLGRNPGSDEMRAALRAILPKLVGDEYGALVAREVRAELFESHLYERIGILSLTEKWDNLLMWAHYADHHRGFVLEFDGGHRFFAGTRQGRDGKKRRGGRNNSRDAQSSYGCATKVRYTDTRPSGSFVRYLDSGTLFTKSKEWEYEQEWRMILPFGDERVIAPGNIHLFPFPPDCLSGVILGCRMDEARKREITGLMRSDPRYRHVGIRQASLHEQRFALQSEEIVDAYYHSGMQKLGRAFRWAGEGNGEEWRADKARPLAEQALPDLTRAIELDPRRHEVYFARGAAYQLYVRDAGLALKDYNAAIKLAPDNADYIVERAKLYVEMQKPDKALADFARANELGHADASDYAAQIRAQKARMRGKRDGRVEQLLARMARALAREDWQGLAELGEQALALDAADPKALDQTADAYAALAGQAMVGGDPERCLTCATRSLELRPESAEVHVLRGMARTLLDDPQSALTDFNRAVKIEPGNAQYYVFRAATYAKLGKTQLAEKDLVQARALGGAGV